MGHFEGPEPSNLYVSPKRGAFSSMFIQNFFFQKILDLCSLNGTSFLSLLASKIVPKCYQKFGFIFWRCVDKFAFNFGSFWSSRGLQKSPKIVVGPPLVVSWPAEASNMPLRPHFWTILDLFWYMLGLFRITVGMILYTFLFENSAFKWTTLSHRNSSMPTILEIFMS